MYMLFGIIFYHYNNYEIIYIFRLSIIQITSDNYKWCVNMFTLININIFKYTI